MIFNYQIPGLDVDMGLEFFDGDLESYWHILESYIKNTPPLLDKLAIDSGDSAAELSNYGVIVHGIKSSSRTVGAEEVGALAESLEFAAKEGNIDFIKSQHTEFIRKTDTLIRDISDMIKALQPDGAKPAKAEPDQALLDELLEACKAFDVDEVDRIMEELESYTYESNNDLILWLREQVNIMGFKQIVARLPKSE